MNIPKLFPFQAEDLETVDYFHGRALIAWMQGMGKTVISLLWAWQNKTARPVVVICPASIKYQWQKEAKDHFGLDFTVLEGGKPGKDIPNTGLYIINYDIVGRTKRSKGWIDWLTALQPKLVIIDEGQRISEPRSIRSRAIKGLCQKVPHVLILSGTPFTSRPIQLWHLVHILKPRLFPSRHEFGLRFCEGQLTHFGWDYSGASRLDELNSILCQNVMVRRRKEDVLTQLPPKQRIVVPVEIENRREYNLALYKFLEWIKLRKPDKLKSAEKAQRLVQLNYLKQLAASLKIKQVKEWISDYLETTGEKLLVFAIHKEMISKLKDLFPQSVVVDGSITGKKRQGAVDAFNQDPNTKLLFGNIDAAGVGINITSTSTSLFVELAWTPGQHLQAEDRCILQGTPILTPTGWRFIENIKTGDLVITHTGEQRKVTNTHKQFSYKPMAELTINGWPEPIITTIDHKILTRDKGWQEAGNLRPGDWLETINNQKTKELSTIKFTTQRVPDEFQGSWGKQKNGRLRHAPDNIEITDDFLFVLGYFAGDGSSSTEKNKGRFFSFSGNTDKKWESLNRCRKWTLTQNLSENERITGYKVERRYYSSEWAYWFEENCGKYAANKKLPKFALNLNKRQSKLILEGLTKSDGYNREGKGRISYSTTSKKLSAHVFALAQRCGYRPSLVYGTTGQFEISWGEKLNGRSPSKVKNVLLRPTRTNTPKEVVYDLTVEKDESFIAGNIIVHNCHGIKRGKGAQNSVSYYLVAKDTLEVTLLEIIQKKAEIITSVLDGANQAPDMDVFSLLTQELLKENAK